MVATSVVVFVWVAVASAATAPVPALRLLQNVSGTTAATCQDPPPAPQVKPKPKPIKVTGSVKDEKGSPVAKARVTITGPEDFEHATWTNGGVFEFTAPDGTGPYRITITVGETEGTFEASIREGRLSPGDFTLRPQ